jgi:hypothetical protein
MKDEPELLLSQFEPDPDGFEGPDRSPAVDTLDWVTWSDAARELAWAEIEAAQITPHLPV